MFSVIPPTGVPISWELVFPKDKENIAKFGDKLTKLLNGEIFLTNSGKSAIYLVLKAARGFYPEKTEVIVPDYTCWSVPSAVVRAGLKVKPVDIDAESLGFSIESLSKSISERTLAVIVTHLFGVPDKINEIEQLCKRKNLLLIDDAAQGLGASLGSRPLGSFGDAGILSFGRGKNITTLHGGSAIVRNKRLTEAATSIYSNEFKSKRESSKIVVASNQENK
ncbi:MAG: aminotransferase class V-fold PLP-dependent enzyme, partial [candidate division Zixibacteria bacterium]|nr:aminotransferase class V-fold PLP-dependent enzyme [candidate division Zixibacteria bacterium]